MRFKYALLVLCLLAVFAAPAFAELGFIAPAEKIEEPYTNDKCLEKCHGLPTFEGRDESGEALNLSVDLSRYMASVHGAAGIMCIDCHQGADPNFHPREGFTDVDCRACHNEEPSEAIFPFGALKVLGERDIKPPPKDARNGEQWLKSKHAKAWLSGNPKAPFCNDCHTEHYIMRPEDSSSSVNMANLGETCGDCHEGQASEVDAGGFLARFRLAGHSKGDLRNEYSVTVCLSCHQGEAAHGETNITGQVCPSCHDSGEEASHSQATRFHIMPASMEQPFAVFVRWLYNIAFWGGIAALILGAAFLWLSARFTRGEEE